MKLPINEIICGAMPEATKVFPDGYFNCSISSPPYWALRDYGVDGQLGLEPTFEEYIDKLCTIYDEVKRVLRADGTCWVNLGDTYACSPAGNVHPRKLADGGVFRVNKPKMTFQTPIKSLCLIPQRFAIEMVNRGWILRNVIIWHKPNPMPSSAKDRFTVDFEYVYFFVKSKKYWFEPQYEREYSESTKKRWGHLIESGEVEYGKTRKKVEPKQLEEGRCKYMFSRMDKAYFNPLGRNKRTVWTIPTQPYPEAHFATFPEKLVEPMILSGCPEFVCTKCGKAKRKVYETDYRVDGARPKGQEAKASGCADNNFKSMDFAHGYVQHHFKGYTDCGCKDREWRPGIVLDPFAGSCTIGKVAAKLRRDYMMIDLKPEYIEMGEKRVMEGETGLKVKEQKAGQMALFKVTQ